MPIVGNDDVVPVGHIHHGAGAFIQNISVERLLFQAGHTAAPRGLFGQSVLLHRLRLSKKAKLLLVRLHTMVALCGVPAEIDCNSEEYGWRYHRADNTANKAAYLHVFQSLVVKCAKLQHLRNN